MWAMALEQIAIKLGYNFLLLSKSSCPPPEVTFWLVTAAEPNLQCDTWRSGAIKQINAFKPAVVIVTGNDFQLYDATGAVMPQSTYQAALVKTLTAVSAPGRKVIVIGDMSYLSSAGDVCSRPTRVRYRAVRRRPQPPRRRTCLRSTTPPA
jgi:hypothetical protein